MLVHIRKLKSENKARFLIDLSGCEYISSEGLGAMSDLWKYCSGQPGGKLAILLSGDTSNDVRYLFETVGLTNLMREGLFMDRSAAEQAFLSGAE